LANAPPIFHPRRVCVRPKYFAQTWRSGGSGKPPLAHVEDGGSGPDRDVREAVEQRGSKDSAC
jgi:hypothetical protein